MKHTGATLATTSHNTALITLGATNALTKLSKDKGNSAGGVLALTIGRALPNKLPSMVERGGLVLGRGVWAMSDTDPLKNKFWNCPKCGKLNLGAWCPCEREKVSK